MFAQGRIACALPNGSELAALLAVLPSSGSPFAPLNPELQLEEMTWELSDVPARAIIVLHKKRANGEMMDDSEEVNVNYGRVAAERLGLPIVELEPSPVACGLFSISLPSELPTQVLKPRLSEGALALSRIIEVPRRAWLHAGQRRGEL